MASAGKDIDQMNKQIELYETLTIGSVQIDAIQGTADHPHQHAGWASKTDGGFGGIDQNHPDAYRYFNGKWKVGHWGDTLEFTPHQGAEPDQGE